MALKRWKSHIDGALSLLKARPAGQKQGPLRSRPYDCSPRANEIPLSIASGLPLDTEFEWIESGSDERDRSLAGLNIEMSRLQSDNKTTNKLAELSAENFEKVIDVLRRAEALEQKYADWLTTVPSSWVPEVSDWSQFNPSNLAPSLVYPGRVYTFAGLRMANQSGVVRSCGILIRSTILRCIAWQHGPHEYMMTDEYAESSRTCRTLIEDITSSVPYYYGRTSTTSLATANMFAHSAEFYASMKGRRASIFLLWPLSVATSSDFVSPSERIYLRGKLKDIGDNLGVNQAVIAFKDEMVHLSRFIEREGATCGQYQFSRPGEQLQSWRDENNGSMDKPLNVDYSTQQMALV